MKGWTISSMLWLIAYLGLGIASIASPANLEGIEDVLLGGLAVWVAAYVADGLDLPRRSGLPRRRASASIICGAAGIVEAIAAVLSGILAVPGLAVWFAAGVGFATAVVAGARRREPSDRAIRAQMVLHCLLLTPGLALLAARVASKFDPERIMAKIVWDCSGFTFFVLTFSYFCFWIAFFFTDRGGLVAERDRPMSALMVAEVSLLIEVGRCIVDQ